MHWIKPSETETAAARSSEQELRKQLIASQAVDGMVAVRPDRRFPFSQSRK